MTLNTRGLVDDHDTGRKSVQPKTKIIRKFFHIIRWMPESLRENFVPIKNSNFLIKKEDAWTEPIKTAQFNSLRRC